MRAVVVREFGGPEVMRVEQVRELTPGAGQVVVRVRAAGVNPVDTYIRTGTYARKPALPYTPGMDAAGVVEAVGTGVTRLKPGDRVYVAGSLSGTYAELALCDPSQVQPLPEGVTFEQGAGVFVPYATAYRALTHFGRAAKGEVVLVHGASGGVGVAAVQIARSLGMTVIGTAGTQEGQELARQQGAHHTLDHRGPEHFDEILELTGGRGADVVLEMLANVNLARDLIVLAPRGRVVVVGSRGTIEIDPRQAMGRDATIAGMSLLNATPDELAALHEVLVDGLEKGSMRPVVGRRFGLDEAPRAHEAVMEPGAHGKIVLVP